MQLAKGATCGPHCYSLAVSLRNFAAGPHTVACWSGHAGQFDSYSTSTQTSSGCSYGHPHDTVWVVVEGHRSNTVTW
ncbi:MAG: hypothetical protein QOH89_196 [Pseudonocardiales bacterium]|nr:hypothetical protein [Pseudonocardiales bacterium]